ncbi:MAG: kelch repeat-containing protein [Terracidiphilus sp.]
MLKFRAYTLALLCTLLLLVSCSAPAVACDQNNSHSAGWVWQGGGNTVGPLLYNPSVYGTQGVPAAANVPGSRYYAQSWSVSNGNSCWHDSKGNLWLFGGYGYDGNGQFGLLSDLWVFSPSLGKDGEWTWVGGSTLNGQSGVYGTLGQPAATNYPGARGFSQTWTDSDGRLWLFGGYGVDAAGNSEDLNDLWVFDPSIGRHGEWAWMGGNNIGGGTSVYGTLGKLAATNVPGWREEAVTWTDRNGNLWLFGGNGIDAVGNQGSLNDLWKFDLSRGCGHYGEWVWMGGSTTVGNNSGQSGVYGTLGVPAAANIPGGRANLVSWTDNNGKLWLFGGYGVDADGNWGILNDLWVFDPSLGKLGEWAWIGGSNSLGSSFGLPGVYGTQGEPAAANIPGGRLNPVSWTDNEGNLWLFGGYGLDANGNSGELNDLWKFDPERGRNGEWTWVDGSSSAESDAPVYGTLGVEAATNTPGGHSSAVSWTDPSGNLWLFGGLGISANNGEQILNDLWEYKLSGEPEQQGGPQGGGGQPGCGGQQGGGGHQGGSGCK